MGKLAVLDISESGHQIGEKLFAVLNTEQKKELAQYVIEKDLQGGILLSSFPTMIRKNILNRH